MEKGESRTTRMITNYFNHSTREEIRDFLKDTIKCPIEEEDFSKDLIAFEKNLTLDDYMAIRSYTGYHFRFINAVLRNTWNYEEHGHMDEDTRKEYLELSESISDLIKRFPSPQKTFQTYRGTTLNEFKKYGIESIEELNALKGKFLYEEGFTSTSLEEEQCYFGKEILGRISNIEVKYILSKRTQDGMPLITSDLSYSKGQKEYVLNKGALSSVIDVDVRDNSAIITVIVIPKKIWDKEEIKSNTEIKQK